jgi:hypothetical protein
MKFQFVFLVPAESPVGDSAVTRKRTGGALAFTKTTSYISHDTNYKRLNVAFQNFASFLSD